MLLYNPAVQKYLSDLFISALESTEVRRNTDGSFTLEFDSKQFVINAANNTFYFALDEVVSHWDEANPIVGMRNTISGTDGTSVGARNANGGTGNNYNPANPGPLNNDIANTFRGGSYTQTVLTEDTTFYRVYGGNAGQVGSYMSRTPQNGTMQSQMDLALNPQWGNTATSVTTVTVPKGTIIYEGFAALQGNLLGGGNQVYIPKEVLNPSWFGH
jgi:hypothetical protein